MPYLSRASIEAIAQRVVTAYKKLPVCKEHPPDTVCPEVLVCDLLGLSMEHHVLSRTGSILGLTSCGPVGVLIFDDPTTPEYYYLDGRTLLIDSSLQAEQANKGRYHFTLVHEACHQIYKMLFPKEYMSGVNSRKIHCCTAGSFTGGSGWEEWRTNTLASAVLMPVDMVLNNMAVFGLGHRLRLLNKVFAPVEYRQFEQMAQHMGVSKQALAIRLKHLGLLEQDHLQAPYALADIYPEEESNGKSKYQDV